MRRFNLGRRAKLSDGKKPARRRGLGLRRGLRRAHLKLIRKATGRVRSELKQFEREPYLAPF